MGLKNFTRAPYLTTVACCQSGSRGQVEPDGQLERVARWMAEVDEDPVPGGAEVAVEVRVEVAPFQSDEEEGREGQREDVHKRHRFLALAVWMFGRGQSD